MSTTTLFVELVIIGLEVIVWLMLLISSIFGITWFLPISTVFDKANLFMSLLTFSVAYVLGIIFDEIYDFFIRPWENRIQKQLQDAGHPKMWDMQAYIFSHSDEATSQLHYVRARLRILRASIFNIALIALFTILFLWQQFPTTNPIRSSLMIFTGAIGIILVGLTVFVYQRIVVSYWLRLRSIYQSLKEDKSSSR